ncbi:MAG: 2-C-methyl-D-erythritol 4-phosphate cytidylyltransferase, partial [Lachnospiraceae bacterium]|nr:2-C-methyl-D-erythritol 4-phosphate cytidylyltransferase [Lachnospiraceae bacterium]
MSVRCTAIVLAAGSGSRMGAGPKKQYLELGAKPLVCHSLQTFEDSFIEDVVLVVPAEDIDYCRREIVERFHFSKVRAVIAGGAERYDSVAAGLRWFATSGDKGDRQHLVFIHDG